ncbi:MULTISPECIES: DUF3817 domain-containing protein [Cryobacterium]|uniref:DUF3817 domain-containing protein n=1 Tax=Cryobacterium breve TaxID=1259258 RepID=A0ABY2IWQ6_9MICO|nr:MULTISPECIES: DUF3817 domain-containing protein [Cryobacterium]TFC90627.1 DUF3817 domain-containing protein [Cryobacterium sp. TmT3-12]TFC96444.1 DUF3817 domain-containing protein [Cryobacterium breve]
MSPRVFYRTIAIAEAVTWTLLIGGMLLKYVADAGGTPVRIAGSLHGFVFISYALTAVLVGLNQRWPVRLMVLAVITAIVPYATVPFDIRLDRTGRLDGDWRRVATDDPRDNTWVGRLLRWMLNRPVVLIGGFAVAAVVIMTVMLSLGPPGGRS